MPWLDDVAAILMQWYNSQECGNALADILFGDTNPSGKLPTTFPQRLADNPAYLNYPGENGRVHYGEGLFVGYRYYDKKEITPSSPLASVSPTPALPTVICSSAPPPSRPPPG